MGRRMFLAVLLAVPPTAGAEENAALVPLPQTAPAPEENLPTAEKVALGKQLFFDPRLSGDNTISCASCHLPEKAFGDGVALGAGSGGKRLSRNTQSCLCVGFLASFFWDGRAVTLEQQALGPIESVDEMNQPLGELEEELAGIAGYARRFQEVFDSPPTREPIAQALAAYQRTLIPGPSPLDRYLSGEKDALSKEAKQGLALFRGEARCIECHHGTLLSDGKYYRLGVSYRDPGREGVTGRREDRFRFRTPPLRNIAETAPYMHDGSFRTLNEVVEFYYRGIPSSGPGGLVPDLEPLTDRSFTEIPLIVAFLESLSGAMPPAEPPLLPSLLAAEPETSLSPAWQDDDGFRLHRVKSPYQQSETRIRVLLPERRQKDKRYPVVYVLPVEAGDATRYGDGLLEVKKHDLHNKHQAIFVAPSFSALPWYADHAADAEIRQEAYFLKIVVPFIEQTYPVLAGQKGRYLLGFSKSGWGAWSLLLRHPKQFARAAAWDAPLMMETLGRYGTTAIFGTHQNFERYRIADRLRGGADPLREQPRLVLTGYGSFRQHHQRMHALLEELKVPHFYKDGPPRKHDWHSGWLPGTVQMLLAEEAP